MHGSIIIGMRDRGGYMEETWLDNFRNNEDKISCGIRILTFSEIDDYRKRD